MGNDIVFGYIYGLFAEDGTCGYVGITINLRSRARRHKRRFPDLNFRVIRSLKVPAFYRRNEIEAQIVRSYWKRGQAKFNYKRPLKLPGESRPNWVLKDATPEWIDSVKAQLLKDYDYRVP